MKCQTTSPYVNFYLSFLRLAADIDIPTRASSFGVNEKALLEEIIIAWCKESPLTINQAINIHKLGSRATLHKRVVRLRQLNLIEPITLLNDKRCKYLVPTSKSIKYINKLSAVLEDVLVKFDGGLNSKLHTKVSGTFAREQFKDRAGLSDLSGAVQKA